MVEAEADVILDAALAHLRAADPVLGGLIEQIGPYVLQRDPDHFYALFSSIVAQQISVRAAATIMGRVEALFPAQKGITAEGVLAAGPEALRAVGLSSIKTRYVLDLAQRVADGRLDLERLASLDDDAVIAELVQVRGIGRWTAEMFLIFALGRPNVLPVDDLGFRVAVKQQ
jgi:3-methyladenine DNA glycosylase/8-oxoguanine DNA glycosylase